MPVTPSKTWSKFFGSRLYLAGGLVILGFLFVALGRAYYQNYLIQQEIKHLQAEAARLQSKKLETLEMLRYVQSPSYVEEKARTELNLQKPGEQAAVIIGGANTPSGQTTPPIVQSAEPSNAIKWWRYFFR